MNDIKLTRALLAEGYNHDDLRRLQQRSELVRVRRGAYATESRPDLAIDERHRRLVLATAPQPREDEILSHASAVLHSLHRLDGSSRESPRDPQSPGESNQAQRRPGAWRSPRSGEVTMIDGVPVTSLTRTVLDLARTLPMEQAWRPAIVP